MVAESIVTDANVMVLKPVVRTVAAHVKGDAIEIEDTVLSNVAEPVAGPTEHGKRVKMT